MRFCIISLPLAAIVSFSAFAQVDIGFEPATYSLGNIAPPIAGYEGQDGWYFPTIPSGGVGLVQIVDTDNGPSQVGVQCLEIVGDTAAYPAGQIRIHKAFTDVVPPEGGIVTFEYDLKWVNAVSSPNSQSNFRPRVLDQANGDDGTTGISLWHDSAMDHFFYGSSLADGSNLALLNQPVADIRLSRVQAAEWNSFKWIVYYGDELDGTYGQLLCCEINGVQTPWLGCFLPSNVSAADLLQVRVMPTSNPPPIFRIDNIHVSAIPMPTSPEGPPVAEAGPDQLDVPSTYGGATLLVDGSGSYDFGTGTVRSFLWADDSNPNDIVAIGEAAAIIVPSNTSGNIRLTVYDNDGLYASDTFAYSTLPAESVPVEDLACPFAVKNGDIFGTGQHPLIIDEGWIGFEVVTQKSGYYNSFAKMPLGHSQFVFDEDSNLYRMTVEYTLMKLSEDFDFVWETEPLTGINLATECVLVGKRFVYTIAGGGEGNSVPNIFAINRATGDIAWQLELTAGEVTAATNEQPLAILLNNKIYYVGAPSANSVNIWQIDCGQDEAPGQPTTPTIDWVKPIDWGSSTTRYGNVVVIPNGDGTVTLAFAGRSNTADDGKFDAVGAVIDPATGETSPWGIDGINADISSVMYSPTLERLFVQSVGEDWGAYGLWSIDPANGDAIGVQTGRNTTPDYFEEAWVLGFDEATIYSAGTDGHVCSFHQSGDPTSLVAANDIYEFEGGAGNNAMIIRQHTSTPDTFRDVIITIFKDRGDGIGEIVAIVPDDAESGMPTEEEGDDGPTYIDNVAIQTYDANSREWVSVYEEDFDSYSAGTFPPPTAESWSFTGTASTGDTVQITDWSGEHGNVCRLDPFGFYLGNLSELTFTLPQAITSEDEVKVRVTWDQYREHLTDAFVISCGDTYSMFQSDWYFNAIGLGTLPNGSMIAPSDSGTLDTEEWQSCIIELNYPGNRFRMWVDGLNNGASAPMLAEETVVEIGDETEIVVGDQAPLTTVRFSMMATPPWTEWTPPTNKPRGSFPINDAPDQDQLSLPVGLSMAPNGDIYFVQVDNALPGLNRRWTRLRIIGTPFMCGDTNCDGGVDVFDIDPFVKALVDADGYADANPHCDRLATCDTNHDGVCDVFDIDPFVEAMVGETCQ